MNIVEMYNAMKDMALATNMVSEVILLKSNDSIDELIKNVKYRSMIIIASNGQIEKDDNDYVFSITIIDKTKEEDNLYLQSVNDGMTVLRLIADSLNYNHNQRVVYSDIITGSGYDNNNGLLVTLNTDVSFEFDTLSSGLKNVW